MNLSATLDGNAVNIVNIQVDGSEVYITYVDASNELFVVRKKRSDSAIATGITIN